jgi:hypothetical protein
MIEQSRRGFIGSLIAFTAAAPAIVRAASLMPVKAIPDPLIEELLRRGDRPPYFVTPEGLSERIQAAARRAFIPRLYAQLYGRPPFCELPRSFWESEVAT